MYEDMKTDLTMEVHIGRCTIVLLHESIGLVLGKVLAVIPEQTFTTQLEIIVFIH